MIAAGLLALLVVLVAGRYVSRFQQRRPSSRSPRPAWLARLPRRDSRRSPGDLEVAMWCEQVAAALRSGDSLTRAITATDAAWTGPPVLPTVAHAVQRGRSLAEALDEVPADPTTATGLAVAVLRSCAHLGGPAASAIARAADTLQARAAERAERQAASAQARLSARVLTIVPFGVFAFLATTDESVREALGSPIGLTCLAAGAALNLGGWWWMRHLIGGTT